MKYIDEYRDPLLARRLIEQIHTLATREWTIMEVCGGQTHTIVRFGLDELLPRRVRLVHGPGCPVCVTPIELIDTAIALAARADVILCSFGDMLRVPGSENDLFTARAAGGDVRVVYSPLDALQLARRYTHKQVVFFAVGFETTAPTTAMAVWQAKQQGLRNFSLLAAHVRVPPAMEAILSSPDNQVQGFLAAGHVCTIMGMEEYQPLARRYRVPIVVTGFEPLDLLQGIWLCVKQLETGRAEVENQYTRSVRPEGNPAARTLTAKIFTPVERRWRGLMTLPHGGLALRESYAEFDAERKFTVQLPSTEETTLCQAGRVLQGHITPPACPAFGSSCTPEHPLGAPMVSSEGACAAYFRFGRKQRETQHENVV
ncbi:MAG: hydrogenase formation protein HypD [Candidatus Binatia bacterium]